MRGIFHRVYRTFDAPTLRLWLQISVVCLLLVFTVGAANISGRYNKLGHQMICTCGCNQVLLECNHVGCTVSTQMEAELRTTLHRGDSDDLILDSFVQRYGPIVLAAPPKRGFDLVAWIAPGAIFLLATLGTALLIRKWRQRAGETTTEEAANPHWDAIRDRVRRETEL